MVGCLLQRSGTVVTPFPPETIAKLTTGPKPLRTRKDPTKQVPLDSE